MLCFRKTLVAKKFMDKWEGEVSRFPSKIFCLTAPKNATGEPFSLSLISGIEKVWMRWCGGGGEFQNFPSKISCLTVPKNFVGQPFRVSLISGIEKFYASGGYVTISVEIFCLTVPRKFIGEPFRVSLIRVSKNFMLKRVMSRFFVKFFLSGSTEKLCRGTLLCCVSENFR